MTNRSNEPAYSGSYQNNDGSLDYSSGMTIREKIAAIITIPNTDNWTVKMIEDFMGRKVPEWSKESGLENINYFAEFDAKLRCIVTDKLIAELSKQPEK